MKKHTLFALLLFSQTLHAQKSRSLIDNLQDVFYAYKVNHIIGDQNELVNLYLGEGDDKELRSLLNDFIKTCEGLKDLPIANDTLKKHLNIYISGTITNYRLMAQKGIKSPEFKTHFATFDAQRDKYMDYLARRYALDRFTHLTEAQYWKVMDKKNYIRSPRFPYYTKLEKTDVPKAMQLLDSIATATNDFQERAIYRIEWADEHVIHHDIQENAEQLAIDQYKSILDARTYNLYLYEEWLKWRAVTQQNNGLSKSSDIPNQEYDSVRQIVAWVILDHIRQHETDEMAINQFLVVATHDIIRRFGEYKFGNQNTIEYHQLFDK